MEGCLFWATTVTLSNSLINVNTGLLWRPHTISAFLSELVPGHHSKRAQDMDTTQAEDQRLLFIQDYVLRTLKLKADRWHKCVSSEDSRQVLQDFMDKAEHSTLVVSLTASGFLQTSATFTVTSKNKAVYFVKRNRMALKAESMKESLVYGDLSYAPLDHFSALVEEVTALIIVRTLL